MLSNQPKVFHLAFLNMVNSKFIQVIFAYHVSITLKVSDQNSNGNCNKFKVIVKANILLPSILICAVKIYYRNY